MRVLAKCSAAMGLVVLPICLNAVAVSPVAADAADSYVQSFEADAAGWDDLDGAFVSRVPSGTAGVQSFDGVYHATLPVAEGDGPFTRWGGYHDSFPAQGYSTRIAVFVATALADGTDKRLDFSSAISTPQGGHRRDFIFHLGTKPGASNVWCASVSNNAPGEPCNPSRQPVELTQSGWYELVSQFRANKASNVLEVEMQILDAAGLLVGSWTLSDVTDVIGETVGGNRYGWFVNNAFAGLPIDAAQRLSTSADPQSDNAPLTAEGAGIVEQGDVSRGFLFYAHRSRKGAIKSAQLRFVQSRGHQGQCDPWSSHVHANRDYFQSEVTSWLSAEQADGYATVTLAGTGRWNHVDGYSFEAVATDRGEPGRDVDRFAIVVRDPSGAVVARLTSTPISLGDIRAYLPAVRR
jgi:hypothetical protein